MYRKGRSYCADQKTPEAFNRHTSSSSRNTNSIIIVKLCHIDGRDVLEDLNRLLQIINLLRCIGDISSSLSAANTPSVLFFVNLLGFTWLSISEKIHNYKEMTLSTIIKQE